MSEELIDQDGYGYCIQCGFEYELSCTCERMVADQRIQELQGMVQAGLDLHQVVKDVTQELIQIGGQGGHSAEKVLPGLIDSLKDALADYEEIVFDDPDEPF